MPTTKKRVGSTTVRITTGRNDIVGIGDRWDAQVEGKVTALAASRGNLFVATSKGIVVRLETQTGRRCARAVIGGAITKLAVRGATLTVVVDSEKRFVKATTLRALAVK